MIKKSLFLAVALCLCLLGAQNPALAGKVTLKLQSQFPSKLPAAGPSQLFFVEKVKAISGGELQFKFYEPGKLVPPMSVLDMVSKGVIQAGISSTAYWAGKIPAASIFLNIPFGPEFVERVAWLYAGNGNKLWQEMYDQSGYNVVVLPLIAIPYESGGWFAKPIKSLDDLKGLKMRIGGLGGDVMKKLGVSVSFMPMGDVFPALEKGALDAAEFSIPSVDGFLGFAKVVKYNYFPGWFQPPSTLELLINKTVWEKKLTEAQREQIKITAMATILHSLAFTEAAQAGVLRNNMDKKGVKNMQWPQEYLRAFRKAWLEVAEEMAAKDAMFKKTWEDLKAFRANYKLWETDGFPARNCAVAK